MGFGDISTHWQSSERRCGPTQTSQHQPYFAGARFHRVQLGKLWDESYCRGWSLSVCKLAWLYQLGIQTHALIYLTLKGLSLYLLSCPRALSLVLLFSPSFCALP